MDLLMLFVMGALALCVAGVLLLIIFVALYIIMDIRRDKKSRKVIEGFCEYSRQSLLDDYTTGCGNEFHDSSETGNPVTDWATFCPYCGNKIRVKE